jgi:molybdopterin-guanine dinucleotide biosynthesis protein A
VTGPLPDPAAPFDGEPFDAVSFDGVSFDGVSFDAVPFDAVSFDAVVLAGGASRRMGGGDKTRLAVGGLTLLDRVLTAVADARVRIVVGDERSTAVPVHWTREEPAGGGPVAALAAGMRLVTAGVTVLLAADLPLIDSTTVRALVSAIARDGSADGSTAGHRDGTVLGDDTGQPQWLCGAWRTASLRRLLAARPDVEGLALRRLFADAAYAIISVDGRPWFDCDTPDDLARAKEIG